MELPSKLLDQTAFITRPNIEDYLLIILDKSIHEEHLSQPPQTIKKRFKTAKTFLTCYFGKFNVTNKSKKIFSTRSVHDDDFTVISISPGAYELEISNDEIKRNIIKEGHFAEADCPFTIKPEFSTLGCNVDNSSQGPLFSFYKMIVYATF